MLDFPGESLSVSDVLQIRPVCSCSNSLQVHIWLTNLSASMKPTFNKKKLTLKVLMTKLSSFVVSAFQIPLIRLNVGAQRISVWWFYFHFHKFRTFHIKQYWRIYFLYFPLVFAHIPKLTVQRCFRKIMNNQKHACILEGNYCLVSIMCTSKYPLSKKSFLIDQVLSFYTKI